MWKYHKKKFNFILSISDPNSLGVMKILLQCNDFNYNIHSQYGIWLSALMECMKRLERNLSQWLNSSTAKWSKFYISLTNVNFLKLCFRIRETLIIRRPFILMHIAWLLLQFTLLLIAWLCIMLQVMCWSLCPAQFGCLVCGRLPVGFPQKLHRFELFNWRSRSTAL